MTRDDRRVTAVTDYMPDQSSDVMHGDVVLSLAQCCGVAEANAHRITSEFAGPYERSRSSQEAIDVLLAVIGRCADARHPFSYLSVPLTTGRAYIELRAREVAAGSHNSAEVKAERQRTVSHNRRRAYETAKRLRAKIVGMVIDPSRFTDVPGWEQPDYHAFWTKVINRYAEEVFFLEGWQYSVGCTIEFSTAVKLGLPTMTTDLAALNALTGLELVRAAVREYVEIGLDPQPLSSALSISERDLVKSRSSSAGD